PNRGSWLPGEQVGQAAGDRLDWRERVVQFVAQHAQQSLPRAAFFLAQRLTQICQYEQLMLRASFAEGAAANVPSAKAPRKNHLHGVAPIAVFTIQTGSEAQLPHT